MAQRKPLTLVNGFFQEVNTPTDKIDLAGNTTTDLTEGTNLYYTDTRARGSLSVSTTDPSPNTGLGSLSYASGTGIFTFTQVTDANVRGLFSVTASQGIDYNSSTGVFGLSNIPNGSLTNSSITITDARGGNTTVNLGDTYEIKEAQNVVELVRNETGVTIAQGTPLAIVGYASSRPLVAPADADDATKMPCIGLAAEQITNNSNGAVVATGISVGYDTSSFTAGDVLYIGTTPGTLTTTKPTGESSLIQNIGKVTLVASNGRILVMGPGRSNAVSNLNNGNIFIGNASNQAVTNTLDTSIVPENTNLYYTDTRSRSAISVTDSGGDGSLSYDSGTGVITYTGPSASDARAHFSVAAGSGLTYNSGTGEFGTSAIPNAQLANSSVTIGSTGIALGGTSATLDGLTSVATQEIRLNDSDASHYVGFGSPATVTTSLIWTLPAADGASGEVLSTNGSGVLSWSTASGGVTSVTGTSPIASSGGTTPAISIQDATTSQKGAVQLTDSTSSTSTTTAATPNSVKTTYDAALKTTTTDVKSAGSLTFNDNILLYFGTGNDAELFCDGAHMYMDLNSGIGNFYIRDGSTTRFTFDDAGDFTATGNVTAYSDINLKEDIQLIPNALDKLKTLKGVTYLRNDLNDGIRHTGVIAQDVEKVLPEAVRTDKDGILSVAYGNMIGILIEAIKEQDKIINELKAAIKS